MELLQVISQSSYSAELSLNTSELPSTNYNVICTSSVDDSSSSLRNHLVTVLDVTFENVSQLTVQPLAPSTNYTCCLDYSKPMYCSDSFVTSGPLGGGLSLEVAGVVGGVVGAVVTLLLIAGITGIAIGIALVLRRKRAITRAKNRPVLRTNSKIYKKKPTNQEEAEMSPASIIEQNLKPPSLPTAKNSSQRRKPAPPQKTPKGKGPLAPPPLPYQGNLYTPQNTEDDFVDSEFEDYDDDEFAEPEETYETMLSTADNVAYKNRSRAGAHHTHKQQRQMPEEYYDYLPS